MSGVTRLLPYLKIYWKLFLYSHAHCSLPLSLTLCTPWSGKEQSPINDKCSSFSPKLSVHQTASVNLRVCHRRPMQSQLPLLSSYLRSLDSTFSCLLFLIENRERINSQKQSTLSVVVPSAAVSAFSGPQMRFTVFSVFSPSIFANKWQNKWSLLFFLVRLACGLCFSPP